MMKEESILIGMVGRENHFSVPNGYFDTFASELMEKLPNREACVLEMRPSVWRRLPIRKIAAVLGAVFVMSGTTVLYMNSQSKNSVATVADTSGTIPREMSIMQEDYGTFDEVADYTMLDNEQIYSTLMAENYKN